MTDVTSDTPEAEETPKKTSIMPLIIGVILAALGGGGGYFAVSAGLLPIGGNMPESELEGGAAPHAEQDETAEIHEPNVKIEDIAYVPLDPLVVSLQDQSGARLLRFSAQLEVFAPYQDDVATLRPRMMDVLNSYLRAVEVTDLSDPLGLARIRAQMLRRVQIVTGMGRVRDLLIMEFVLN